MPIYTPTPELTPTPEPILPNKPSQTPSPAPSSTPSFDTPDTPTNNQTDKQELIKKENERYQKEIEEINSKFIKDIQTVEDEIYKCKMTYGYYSGTEAQYNSEISSLNSKISSLKTQIAVLSGNNSEETRLKLSKLKKELQKYEDQLSVLESSWTGRLEVDKLNGLSESIRIQYDIDIALAEKKHEEILASIG